MSLDLNQLRQMPKEELAYWIRKNPKAAQAVREALYWMRVRVAREDPNEFCELVLRDEEKGTPIVQAPTHERFQKLAVEHDRLIVWGHVESGKTMQLSIGHTLWELGRNPRLRFVIASATTRYSSRIVSALRRYIEQPGPLHDIFPNLKPGPVWSATAITVEIPARRACPRIQACRRPASASPR